MTGVWDGAPPVFYPQPFTGESVMEETGVSEIQTAASTGDFIFMVVLVAVAGVGYYLWKKKKKGG